MHPPIQIKDLNLSFPHKTCFEGFSTLISFGERIGVIGRNGSGKSFLLRMIAEQNPSISQAYIPQIISDFDLLSGGERFNKALSSALGKDPLLLLLDEPTNHLDLDNRKSLMRLLKTYYGTLIIATHDKELLRNCIQILWHIDDGIITVFRGSYDDYISEKHLKRQSLAHQIDLAERERKSAHQQLIKEQERTSKSIKSGKKKVENKKWMKSVGDLKAMKAEKSQGNKLKNIDERKRRLSDQLNEMRLPENITPKFKFTHQDTSGRAVVSIADGTVGYADKVILRNINFSVGSQERVAIIGPNGSGKTTLVKAICGNEHIVKSGSWNVPKPRDIGCLDQHYDNLDPEKSALEVIWETGGEWRDIAEVRSFLNDYLFRKNEEVNAPVKTMSGGEKARLSLAKIAANPPKLLILDEITNNIDMETRDHLIAILRQYPSSIIAISHDEDFLHEIGGWSFIEVDEFFNR
ncbi:MAG: ATP-binding cassette domain-containing protein [Holosporales bacterium]|jgi:ATPase subunit of ABC transporter with duplicated ATPase domains|nr:ATP-binding cassette domain-containing protein [Holosporales bacterium]